MNRQTATFLSKRLQEAGLRPVSRFGQNFLIDLNLVELIANSAELRQTDVVLEIGTGVGSLTTLLSEQAGAVLTVEIDRNLFRLASEELEDRPNVKMLLGDALRNKNSLRDDILENIEDAITRIGKDARFMLVANLPYNVATPIVSNLLRSNRPPDRMVVTIQKELGDRMIAKPSTKDYGALSVWLQSLCDIEIVRVLPPTVFWPRPKVHSAIVRLDTRPGAHESFADLAFFHESVRALFFHRRKFLRSVVISAMKGRMTKEHVDELLADLGHDGSTRAEALEVPQIQALVEGIRLKLASIEDSTG